jgi:hypothetical protein
MPRKRKVVGLFRPISRKEMKGYSRTLSNPLGVTTIATVNGRGRSARSVARTESPAARFRRAQQLLKGASSMRTHRGYRRNAGIAALGGMSKAKALKSKAAQELKAARAAEKTARRAAAHVRLDRIKASRAAKAAKAAVTLEKRRAALAKGRATRSAKARARWPAQYSVIRKVTKRHVQTGFGPYKRVLARKPTGKQALSWLYAKRKGRKVSYRKIPAKAVEAYSGTYKSGPKKGEHKWTRARIDSLRSRASARVAKSGSAWTPNLQRGGPIKTKRRAKLMRAMRTYMGSGLNREVAAKKALRKYPLAQGQIFAGFMRVGKGYVTCATRTHRPTSKRKGSTTYMKRHGSFTRNRKSRRRLRVARRSTLRRNPPRIAFTANRKRRVSHKRRASRRLKVLHVLSANRKNRRSRKARKATRTVRRRRVSRAGVRRRRVSRRHLALTPNRRRRHARRHLSPNKRRHSRRHSRRFTANRRRSYRRNGFMADLLNVLKTGAIVGAGFLTHRLLTNLAVDFLLIKSDGTGMLDKMADGSTKTYLKLFARPLTGLVVVAAGIPLSQAVLPSKKVEVGAGMVASLIQQLLIAGFNAASKTPTDSMAIAAKEISGYQSSVAYGLHGQNSIMPLYSPVGEYFTPMRGLGGFSQAAAGYSQAAAGFSQAAAGYNATGEYFAPASLQGIGQYEGAGEQALLPSANTQVIDDGLRPDGDLDSILDLAESAAGVNGRRGVGEYYSAQRGQGGGYSESVVPMRSQWQPNGPLWAGTLATTAGTQSSEVPAGILASGGGNGILSG